jgi:hypothetical protein
MPLLPVFVGCANPGKLILEAVPVEVYIRILRGALRLHFKTLEQEYPEKPTIL